jgi:hypothetical protein
MRAFRHLNRIGASRVPFRLGGHRPVIAERDICTAPAAAYPLSFLSQHGKAKGRRSYPLALRRWWNQAGRKVVCCTLQHQEDFMRIKLLVAAAGFAAFATPALAAEFYIVQDTTTKRCTIVEQRPTSQTMVVVGPGIAFTTRSEAETSMKTVKVCESGGTVGGPVAPAVPR